MYTNYNIPQNKCNYQRNYRNSENSFDYGMNYNYPTTYYNNGDRFIGYLLGRPNYQQGPIPVYFPPQPMPYYPPYSNTNIYY